MSIELRYAIIEDSKKVCNGIKERMDEYANWKLASFAHHVDDAIKLIKEQKPQLIFLDWSLKGGSAFEVLQHVQNIIHYNPYIIFNTGYQNENPEIPQEIINNYSIDKYIVKPIFEKLRMHLPEFLQEAQEKASSFIAASNAIWIVSTEKTKIKLSTDNILCICQNPTDARSRIIYQTLHPFVITIPYTWEKCFGLLEQSGVSFFVTKARESVVIKKHIEHFEKPFVRLKEMPFKIEVTKEKIKNFEEWLAE